MDKQLYSANDPYITGGAVAPALC